MRCEECGFNNDDNIKICTKCGTKLSANSGSDSVSAAKTVKGGVSSQPAWDSQPSIPESNFYTCPSCSHYPLKSEVSANNPCVNCGFTGNQKSHSDEGVSNKPKNVGNSTVRLEDVFKEDSKPSFTLTDIKSGEVFSLSGDTVELGRDELDPENNTISSKHAKLKHSNGQWMIDDLSSNKATFIQVESDVPLKTNTNIVLGNKIYKFEKGK